MNELPDELREPSERKEPESDSQEWAGAVSGDRS